MNGSEIRGLLVTDEGGRVAFAVGLGRDQRVRDLAADPAWMTEAREQRLSTLTLDRQSFAVLVAPAGASVRLGLQRLREVGLSSISSVRSTSPSTSSST